MAGVSMVQPLPFSPRERQPDRNIYHCKYCKELRVAQNFQQPEQYKESKIMSIALVSLLSLAFYIFTGNEVAFASWILVSLFVWFS